VKQTRGGQGIARNLGPVSSGWLVDAGIDSLEALRGVGAAAAYVKVKSLGYPVSLNLLWALAGAIEGCPWNRLPDGMRECLLLELDALEHPPF